MRIVDESCLDRFRGPGPCQWCGKHCKAREPHHLWAKGLGGGGRLDIAVNLIALGSSALFQCDCHTRIHNGEITRFDLLAIVAQREKVLQSDIEDVVYRLRGLDKDADAGPVLARLAARKLNRKS